MVEAAATALAQSVDLCGGPHFCTGKEPCACRKDARAILTAVAPLIAAAEREACAKIPDAFVKTADEFEAKGVNHTGAIRTTALGIASLIRNRPHA
jgi:hypothetical protein